MNLSVWHALKPNFGMGAAVPFTEENYKLVAVFPSHGNLDRDLGRAFQLTNHIDHPWWENEEVTLIGNPNHRSTSVGDVVVDPEGRAHRCEMVGWKRISE